DRIGLVGPNGAGKTTLLRIAAGRDEPDGGSVHHNRGLSIGLLAQESHFDAAFMAAPDLRAAVRHGAADIEAMGERLADLERAGRVQEPLYADLQHEFEARGGYTLDLRVDEALSGLGFTRDEWAKPPTALSGGEQTRATLARLVIAQPDLLLLDEPTNHLDIAALEWLEEHLRRRHGAVLVASHDRAFLDAAARSGEIVVRAENLVVGYLPGRGALDAEGRPATEARRVATAPFLATQRGDRIGIVGPNGAGKTTLLRTIAGDLPPIDGSLS